MSAALSQAGGRLAKMARQLSRDKADTLLLLLATLMVLAPHAGHLPLWVSALCCGTLALRALITLRGKRMPPSLLLLPVSVAAMVGVFMTFHTLLGRDAGVAMLVLLVAFKTLEMHARRDLFVVVFLCLFLVLTNFFYSQSILTALMMIISVITLLTAQLSFQFTGAVPSLRRRLAIAAKIVAIAAPLALVLFFVFPRVQGPLWGMPGDATGGSTGLSNSMAPGNLSSLAQSEEIAFQVKFLDPAPPQQTLYWRGLVLGDFDGRTWTRGMGQRRRQAGNVLELRGSAIRHEVTLEPNNNRWLFALDMINALPALAGENHSRVSTELELSAENMIDKRIRYQVASHTDYSLERDALVDAERWLTLPRGFNPRAMQAGLDLQQLPDKAMRVRRVLEQFNKDGFSYTLEPPLLGRHSVDEFLYNSRAGFCEHYASAFVFLMRAADIPARVVTGYQGGEINPLDGFMTVRQSDAHAWTEVWLEGRGWIRVDPTAAVSPERIQRSTARAKPPKPSFAMEALNNLINLNGSEAKWLRELRFRIGAINNGWNQWVLNYTPERQSSFLDKVQSALQHWQTGAAFLLLMGLIFVVRAIRSRREKDPIDALYSALCQRLGQLGMGRARDEGPSGYAERLSGLALAQEKKHAAVRFLQLYSAHKYGPKPSGATLLPTLKSLLKAI